MADLSETKDDVIVIEDDDTQSTPPNKTKKVICGIVTNEEVMRRLRQVYVGNPPLVNTEEVLRAKFSEFGEILNVTQYYFCGSLNVHIEYASADSVKKALSMHLQNIEGHRIRVDDVWGKYSRPKNLLVIMMDDPNQTEDDLFAKYKKDTKLLYVNKLFPHLYLVFEEDGIAFQDAINKYKNEGIDFTEIKKSNGIKHIHLLGYQNTYPDLKSSITVSNLKDGTSETEIRTLFNKYGKILNKIEGKMQGAATDSLTYFLKFENEEIAKSTTELDNTFVNGRRIHVYHGDSYLTPDYKRAVLVDNLKLGTPEEEVYDFFKEIGELKQVTTCYMKAREMLVEFKDESSVEKAIKAAPEPISSKLKRFDVHNPINVYPLKGPFCTRVIESTEKTVTKEEFRPKTEIPKFDIVKRNTLHKLTPLYVSNLPSLDRNTIAIYFNKYACLRQLIFLENDKYYNAMDVPGRICLVYYKTLEEAEEVKRRTHLVLSKRHRMNVVLGRPKSEMPLAKLVKVTDLIKSINEEALYDEFSKFGPIDRLVKSNSTTAFVLFKDEDSKAKAISQNFIVSGHKINVIEPTAFVEFKLANELIGTIEKNMINLRTALLNEVDKKLSAEDVEVIQKHCYMLSGRKKHTLDETIKLIQINSRKKRRMEAIEKGDSLNRGNNISRDSRPEVGRNDYGRARNVPARGEFNSRMMNDRGNGRDYNQMNNRGGNINARDNYNQMRGNRPVYDDDYVAKRARTGDDNFAEVQTIDKKSLEKLLEMAFNSGKNAGEIKTIEKLGLLKSQNDIDSRSINSNNSGQNMRNNSLGGEQIILSGRNSVRDDNSFRDQSFGAVATARDDYDEYSRERDFHGGNVSRDGPRNRSREDSYGDGPSRNNYSSSSRGKEDLFGGISERDNSRNSRNDNYRNESYNRNQTQGNSFGGGRDIPSMMEDSYQGNRYDDDFRGFSDNRNVRNNNSSFDKPSDYSFGIRGNVNSRNVSRNFDDDRFGGASSFNDIRDTNRSGNNFNNYLNEMEVDRPSRNELFSLDRSSRNDGYQNEGNFGRNQNRDTGSNLFDRSRNNQNQSNMRADWASKPESAWSNGKSGGDIWSRRNN